ncbi:ATP synthase complex assembly protein atp12 [Arthrobotrys musiformis]|uniref:ATP synthase complex assembly protein atp12 n=1 Tax=Arthrobotrys musiformis TaxID=47236 RepID=A0AAV9W6C2_9PEZI
MITRKSILLLRASRQSSVCWRCTTSLSTPRITAITPRYLHTTRPNYATPLPLGGTVDGPPPDPPVPQSEYITRNRLRQASIPKPRTERFWEDVHLQVIDGRYRILLDARSIKTSAKNDVSVPVNKPLLAYALQVEWATMRNSKEALKSHFIPLTSLASRAIDLETAERDGAAAAAENADAASAEGSEQEVEMDTRSTREQITDFVMGYLDTDTVLMISPTRGGHLASAGEKQLRDRQLEVAYDIVEWAQESIPVPDGGEKLDFVLSDGDHGILPSSQSARTKQILRDMISKFSAWDLVGLECAVILSKSLLVGLRLVMENKKTADIKWDVEDAAKACNLETDFQVEQWGLVEDTHDVGHADLRRGLGAVVLLVSELDIPTPEQ